MASLQERVNKICFVIFSFLLSVLVSFIFRFFTLYSFIFYLLSFIFYLLSFIFYLLSCIFLSYYPFILLSCYFFLPLFFFYFFNLIFQCIFFVFLFAFYCSYFFLLFLRLSRKYLDDSPDSLIHMHLMIRYFPMFFFVDCDQAYFISVSLIKTAFVRWDILKRLSEGLLKY